MRVQRPREIPPETRVHLCNQPHLGDNPALTYQQYLQAWHHWLRHLSWHDFCLDFHAPEKKAKAPQNGLKSTGV